MGQMAVSVLKLPKTETEIEDLFGLIAYPSCLFFPLNNLFHIAVATGDAKF